MHACAQTKDYKDDNPFHGDYDFIHAGTFIRAKTKTATGALALQRMPCVADRSANDSQGKPVQFPWESPPRTKAGRQTYEKRINAIVALGLHDLNVVVNPSYQYAIATFVMPISRTSRAVPSIWPVPTPAQSSLPDHQRSTNLLMAGKRCQTHHARRGRTKWRKVTPLPIR